jgi:hypothetical protein
MERWRQAKIPIRRGVAPVSIAAFEARYRVTMPSDVRQFFLTVDGTGDHYDESIFCRFWPLKEVQPISSHLPELEKHYAEASDYFLFFDHSIDLFMYAVRLQKNPIAPTPVARLYPQVNGSFEPAYNSFTQLIAEYANNPDNLL